MKSVLIKIASVLGLLLERNGEATLYRGPALGSMLCWLAHSVFPVV